MGKFDGILICTDLDGTLYKNDKTISIENKDAIEYFEREGGAFTFITGRMPYYSMDAFNAVAPNVPFGCVNGAGVYDGAAEKYIWTKNDMSNDVFELISYVDQHFLEVGIQVCTFEKTYFCKENSVMYRFRKQTGLPNYIANYYEVNEQIAKIIFGSDKPSELLEIEKALREHPLAESFDFISSEKSLFEILPRGVNKGLSLVKLVEYLGIDSKKTIAIGDYNNDIGMFESAAIGVAVSNACQAALDAADYITVSNEEHAIAQVICDLENGKLNF